MPAINDNVFDSGLAWAISTGTRLHILSGDIGLTYGSIAGAQLASAAVTQTGPANAVGGTGRAVTCPETSITPTSTGTATHWAISNNAGTVVSSGVLSSPLTVNSGVAITVAAFPSATIRDAA